MKYVVRKIFANNTIVTILGKTGDCSHTGDYKQVQNATLNYPTGIVVTPFNEILVADTRNNVVRVVTEEGVIQPLAGKNVLSDAFFEKDSTLNVPQSVYVTQSNDVFIVDFFNQVIKKLSNEDGKMSIIAGKRGIQGYNGNGSKATDALLWNPFSVFVNENTNDLFIADRGNHIVRKVDKYGMISTVAGIPRQAGYSGNNMNATQSKLNGPTSIYVTKSGEIFIADQSNNLIRKVNTSNVLIDVAGRLNSVDYRDGIRAIDAGLAIPFSVFVRESSNEIFIVESGMDKLRKINSNGTIQTLVAGRYMSHLFVTER